MITADIATHLTGSQPISGLIGDRVFAKSAPEGAEWPRIVLSTISDDPEYGLQGEVGIDRALVQVDCWAKDTNGANGLWQADRLAKAVRNRLSGYRGTAGDTFICSATIVRNSDDDEPVKAGSDERKYRYSMDFEIVYQTATVPDFT